VASKESVCALPRALDVNIGQRRYNPEGEIGLSMILEAVEVFKRRRKFYESIDMKIAAVNWEKAWHNVFTRVLLSSDKATHQTVREIDVGNFMVLSQNFGANDFPAFLETIEQDNFAVDGVEINFFAGTQHNLSFDDWHSNNSDKAREFFNIDWPLDVFKWQVAQKVQDVRHILKNVTSRLNCHNPPYEDVFEAVRDSLGLHEYLFREQDTERYSTCYMLLPNYLSIGNCKLRGRKLSSEIRFHSSINPRDVRLNIIAEGRTLERRQEAFRKNQVRRSDGFCSIKASMSLPSAHGVQLYPFLKGRENEGPSERRYVRNLLSTANPRFAANEIFGASAEKLMDWLDGQGKRRSEDFEHAITILLHVCGFSSEWLDRGNLAEDAPDILAFCSEPQALIVGECKTDVFGWKELIRVVDRAQELCQELRIDTYPVMFTSMELADVEKTTREKALDEYATIIGAQEIEEILKMALSGNEPRQVLARYFQYGLKYSPA
jgi:hypothetical protein